MGITAYVRRVSPRLWFSFKFLRYKYLIGECEILALRDFVPRRDGKIAIDVGSAIGLYSRALAALVPKVVAFEANPVVAEFARTVAPRNVEVINVALSSAAKRATLRIPVDRRGHTVDDLATVEQRNDFAGVNFVAVDVVAEPLDAFGFADCGFIKIDVEGHEEDVLEGAKDLIERNRPVLMIELEERHNPGNVERVTQLLSRLGYAGHFLSQGQWRPIAEFRADRDQDLAAILKVPLRLRRKARYICNFVFVPPDAKDLAIGDGKR